jgi:hypothetical protein
VPPNEKDPPVEPSGSPKVLSNRPDGVDDTETSGTRQRPPALPRIWAG